MIQLLVRDGAIFAADTPRPDGCRVRRGCVAARDGRIVAVGNEADCRAALGGPGSVEVIDAGGGSVLPGLVDCHGHLWNLGERMSRLDLRPARSFDEVVALVRERASGLAPGAWVVGHGWDHSSWGLPDYPAGAAAALGAAAPAHPVFLNRFDGHAGMVNERALRAAGIGAATPDPPGGAVVRDAGGAPTGVLLEGAARAVRDAVPAPDAATGRRFVELAARHCLALGLTGVFEAVERTDWVDAYRSLADADAAMPRVHGMLSAPDAGDLGEFAARHLFGDHADGMVTMRRLRLISDGGLGVRGAWLFEPYHDRPETSGFPMLTRARIAEAARAVLRLGYSLCTHAIGDRAVALVLDGYADALAGHPPADHRFMIEHATVVRPADAARMARLGAVASVQPVHVVDDIGFVRDRLGPARADTAYAFRRLRAAGVGLALGSDFPVAAADPLLGIHAAETRAAPDGDRFEPDQRLTRAEAVYGYTRWAAHAAGLEADLGTVEPGKRADLTVLDTDIFTADAADAPAVSEARVSHTIVAGRPRYVA